MSVRPYAWIAWALLAVSLPALGGAEPLTQALSLRDTPLPVPGGGAWTLERDPFVPPTGPRVAVQETALELKAIIYHSPERAVAIINHETVRPGERIFGKRVAAIRPDRVILEDEAGRLELLVGRFTYAPRPRPEGGTP